MWGVAAEYVSTLKNGKGNGCLKIFLSVLRSAYWVKPLCLACLVYTDFSELIISAWSMSKHGLRAKESEVVWYTVYWPTASNKSYIYLMAHPDSCKKWMIHNSLKYNQNKIKGFSNAHHITKGKHKTAFKLWCLVTDRFRLWDKFDILFSLYDKIRTNEHHCASSTAYKRIIKIVLYLDYPIIWFWVILGLMLCIVDVQISSL